MSWFKSKEKSSSLPLEEMSRIEDMAIKKELGLKTEAFPYTPHVFELNQQVKKEVEALLLEEGKMTFGLSNILSMTEYTTDQIHQVEEHLGHLAKNNTETVNAVEEVFVDLKASKAEVDKASEGMAQLTRHMDEVSEVFEDFFRLFDELQNQYQSIGSLATIITNIASQTNMLSLNATIEAARVGEAGKGFAVVANEIKKLSQDTQNSATDIMESLNRMTTVMKNLNEKSDQGKKAVSETTEMISGSQEFLENIVKAENIVHDHLGVVKSSQDENTESIVKLTTNMRNVADKSASENKNLETLIFGIQKKADYYLYILNHLNQINCLEREYTL